MDALGFREMIAPIWAHRPPSSLLIRGGFGAPYLAHSPCVTRFFYPCPLSSIPGPSLLYLGPLGPMWPKAPFGLALFPFWLEGAPGTSFPRAPPWPMFPYSLSLLALWASFIFWPFALSPKQQKGTKTMQWLKVIGKKVPRHLGKGHLGKGRAPLQGPCSYFSFP